MGGVTAGCRLYNDELHNLYSLPINSDRMEED
jgi:hypothetical protein